MAFNTMNNGYGEQQSNINWAKVGLYGGAGIVAGGAARMAWKGIHGSEGAGWARDQAKKGWGKAGGKQGLKDFASDVWGNIGSGKARRKQARRGAGMVRGFGDDMVDKGVQEFLGSGGKSGSSTIEMGSKLRNVRNPGNKGIGNGMKKAGFGALSYFSGAGFSGGKRAGVMAGRAGLLGAGIAAADFLNPFSLGWND